MLLPWITIELIWPNWIYSEALPMIEAFIGLASEILLFAILMYYVFRTGLMGQLSAAIGPVPSRSEAKNYALLSIPLIAISIFGLYFLYLPLSYSSPDFVSWWVLDQPPMIWWNADAYYITASIVNAFLIIILAPILEELIFRGFLLNRWKEKYGSAKAIVLSSLIFGLLHVEILGGVVFGALLCLIYLKTKSLIGPIIVHMTNNAIAVLWVVCEGMLTGEIAYTTTMEEFHSEWWWAVICAVIGIPWLYNYTKNLLESFPKTPPKPDPLQAFINR